MVGRRFTAYSDSLFIMSQCKIESRFSLPPAMIRFGAAVKIHFGKFTSEDGSTTGDNNKAGEASKHGRGPSLQVIESSHVLTAT